MHENLVEARAVTIRDLPTEGSRKRSGTEEEGDTGLRAVARVPDREVQDDTLQKARRQMVLPPTAQWSRLDNAPGIDRLRRHRERDEPRANRRSSGRRPSES